MRYLINKLQRQLTMIAVLLASLCVVSLTSGCGGGGKGGDGGGAAPASTTPTPEPVVPPSPVPSPPPAKVTLMSPNQTPYIANGNSLVLSGTCLDSHLVVLSGASTDSLMCQSGVFSFTISKTVDATYTFNLIQKNSENTPSESISFVWERDTLAPAPVTILSPTSNPYSSGTSQIILSGDCEADATINLTSTSTQTTVCSTHGSYSFTISENVDNTYYYLLNQTDKAGNKSSDLIFTWTRSTAVSPPSITTPNLSPYTGNVDHLTISGQCLNGYSVHLGGDSNDQANCVSGSYSFVVANTTEGIYSFSIYQKDLYGNLSSSISLTWILDKTIPLPPTVLSPTPNPFTSGDESIVIQGDCESQATVQLSGDSNQSITCSAGHSYQFSVSQTLDGVYTYNLVQIDSAGNTSQSYQFQWVKDTTIPVTPSITSPAQTMIINNLSALTISGTCTNGYMVDLSGDASATSTCIDSAFSFLVTKSVDGSFNFQIVQTNTSTGAISGATTLTWIRDTVAPTAPTKISPSLSPYISSGNLEMSGTCEPDSMVNLMGDTQLSQQCSNGSYTFLIIGILDGTYNYSISQTDLAGNNSTSFSQTWIRNSILPSTPSIQTPITNPYLSNANSLTIAGQCTSNLTVHLGGDITSVEINEPANSLTQICQDGHYSFNLTKALDGNFSFTIHQVDAALNSSAQVTQVWNKDTLAPDTQLLTTPTNPNLSTSATFTFSSNDATAILECSLDGSAYTPCTSPKTFTSLSNSNHTFSVRSKDSATNVDATPATYTWTQSSGLTIALYHFTTGTEMSDSSYYTGANSNALSNTNVTTGITGKFGQGVTFNGTSAYLSRSHTGSLAQLGQTVSIETFAKLVSLPTNRYAFVAKMNTSPNLGWELGIKKQGSNYKLYFIGSVNGTTTTEITGTNLTSSEQSAIRSGFVHVAVTFNKGSVKLYLNGISKGSGSIGTVGTASLYNATGANLYIGRTQSGNYLNGSLDQVRISQTVRWTTTFVPPTSAYVVD